MARRGELVAEVSNPEQMKFALGFGADAVCLYGAGGQNACGSQYSEKELAGAVAMAHGLGKKLYLAMRVSREGAELAAMPGAICRAQNTGVDAIVAAGPGMLRLVRMYAPGAAVHYALSGREAGKAGMYAAVEQGARRVLLPPELSLAEIADIRANTPRSVELEVPVLGELRAEIPRWHLLEGQPRRAFTVKLASGNMISFEVEEDADGCALVAAQDLCALPFLDALLQAGVTGMRFSANGWDNLAFSAAACSSALSAALDAPQGGFRMPEFARRELQRIEHRPWCAGFYLGDMRFEKPESKTPAEKWRTVGVLSHQHGGLMYCELKGPLALGQTLEALSPEGRLELLQPQHLWLSSGIPAGEASPPEPGFIIPAPAGEAWPAGTILRRQV